MSFFYKPYTLNLFQLINSTINNQTLRIKPCDAQPNSKNNTNLKRNKIIRKERAFLSALLKPGSLTVEAALVLPIFLFAIIAILYLIQIIYAYETLQQSLVNTAKAASTYAYEEKYREGFFYLEFLRNLDMDYISGSGIVGGAFGIDFSKTKLDEESQRIDLIINYRIKNIIDVFDISYLSIHQCVSAKAWTGYRGQGGDSNEESMKTTVYVAENGKVYHASQNCTHLNLSIKTVFFSQIESLRNVYGGKYYSCERCGSHDENHQVYVTDTGTNYHSELSCSGLKRTVYEKALDEQMTLPPCSRCAK